jgi:hypothetical protein
MGSAHNGQEGLHAQGLLVQALATLSLPSSRITCLPACSWRSCVMSAGWGRTLTPPPPPSCTPAAPSCWQG